MEGSFVDERTDLGLELELITDAQISSQDAMFRTPSQEHFREERHLL